MARRRRRKRHMYGAGADYMMGFGDFGSFGAAGRDHIAGPLVGGGLAQVGLMATKLIWPDKPVAKWAGAIGLGLGGLVSGILATRPGYRTTGISGLVTAALVGVPRQIEDLLGAPGATAGYLGVITPEMVNEQGYQGYLGQTNEVELLDSGAGAGTLGVITPERGDMMGQPEMPQIELLGNGFGSNFLSPA